MKYRTEFIGNNGRLVAKSLYAPTYKTRKRAAKLAAKVGCTTLTEINLETGEPMDLSDYLKVKEAEA